MNAPVRDCTRSGTMWTRALWIALAIVLATSLHTAAASPLASPAALQQTAGSGQLGVVNETFPLMLSVRVTDSDGMPTAGVPVHFVADHCLNNGFECLLPAAYPFFQGPSDSAVVTSGADGLAVAPALTAGDVAEFFEVTATIYADASATMAVASTYFWVEQVDASSTMPITSSFTGAWYDPNQSGHGLLVEVLPENRLLAYWFAFTPDNAQQAWFGGVGDIIGNQAIINANQGQGGRWIPDFDPALYSSQPWGTLTLTFSDCGHGRVDFAGGGDASPWSRGHMDLTRLTQPAGLSCP